jgi:ketosteroid isomerase-like protein
MGSPDETAVAAANLAFYRALEARDLSAMDLVWLHEEAASCIHPGWHRLDGWSEIRRSWENIFANARPCSVSYEDLRVRVSGDVAWVTCVELLSPFGSDPEDGAARMQATNIFARRDGRWDSSPRVPILPAASDEADQPVN